MSSRFSAVGSCRATKIAWERATVSRTARPWVRSVLPVETRSQTASATCKVGATSTEPFKTTTSASMW